MKTWSSDASLDCPQQKDSIDDFFKEEINIIEDHDMALDAVAYFNVDELE